MNYPPIEPFWLVLNLCLSILVPLIIVAVIVYFVVKRKKKK